MSSQHEVSPSRLSASTDDPTPTSCRARSGSLRSLLERGQIFFEKCELQLAKATFLEVVERVQQMDGLDAIMTAAGSADTTLENDVSPREAIIEASAVLLRLAAEAGDESGITYWDAELERHLPYASGRVLALAWHKRGVVASHHHRYREAQTLYYRSLKAFEASHDVDRIFESSDREALKLYATIWYSIAVTFTNRELWKRAELSSNVLLDRFKDRGVPGILTQLYIMRTVHAEHARDFAAAKEWVRLAHASVLADRNWYFHFYVLLAYARIERQTRNFQQAYWYLDLVEKATVGPEYGNLRAEAEAERELLENDAVDLLIDSRQCEIRTREKRDLSLGKQYVLLGILEALTEAHYRNAPDAERGLSKSQIIEQVWREKYRPEAHDNKLYYNINRLRKLIEPDMKHPRYLLNWKEGYRLAPGLKVHFIGGRATSQPRGTV